MASKTPPFDRLYTDVLRIICQQVYLSDRDDLLQLCRVSRKLYQSCIPWIYRALQVNLTKPSHLQLLHRISRQGCRIPYHIRKLEISGTLQTKGHEIVYVRLLCKSLTNLELFGWSGFANAPLDILDMVCKFPQALLNIQACQISPFWSADLTWPRYHAFNHDAMLQLSHLDISPSVHYKLYKEFKADLVKLLTKATEMRYLKIGFLRHSTNEEFPEMVEAFRISKMPRLHWLDLLAGVQVFTSQELSFWGASGSWSELRNLSIYTRLLPAFIGRAHQLEQLRVCPYAQDDIVILKNYLAAFETEALPSLKFTQLAIFFFEKDPGTFWLYREAVPLALLKLMPEVGALELAGSGNAYTPLWITEFNAPMAIEIGEIRVLCPKLNVLHIHFAVGEGLSNAVLSELALFKAPFHVLISVHVDVPKDARSPISKSKFDLAFQHMISERTAAELPKQQFSACFRVLINSSSPSQPIHCIPDCAYEYEINEKGSLRSETRRAFGKHRKVPKKDENARIMRMSDDELQKRLWKPLMKVLATRPILMHLWSRRYSNWLQKLEDIEKEMESRRYNANAVAAFGEDTTLFDLWD